MVDYCNCKQAMHTFGKLYVCVSDKMHRCYFYSQSFEIEQIYLLTWHTIHVCTYSSFCFLEHQQRILENTDFEYTHLYSRLLFEWMILYTCICIAVEAGIIEHPCPASSMSDFRFWIIMRE